MRALLYVAIISVLPAVFIIDSPELMQQYGQRIGGHASELRSNLRDFDDDARRSNLKRSEALGIMDAKPDKFFKDRAVRIRGYEQRLGLLEEQEEMLRHRTSLFTVLNFYRNYDEKIYQETIKYYRWAVNPDGVLLALMAWLLTFAVLSAFATFLGGEARANA